MSIILVRHGETALNRARVLQPADTALSDLGLAQAEAVALFLLPLRPAGVISSDLPRALQTAESIGRATGLGVETSDLLQERNFGNLRGKPYDALGFDPLTAANAPPGGESAAAFEQRVGRAFAWVLARRSGLAGPLVVVTHGLVLRQILTGWADLAGRQGDDLNIGNTAVSILDAQPPYVVTLLNSTRHLAAAYHEGRGLVGG